MSVYAMWRQWWMRHGYYHAVESYAQLYARLTNSPAARRVWEG